MRGRPLAGRPALAAAAVVALALVWAWVGPYASTAGHIGLTGSVAVLGAVLYVLATRDRE